MSTMINPGVGVQSAQKPTLSPEAQIAEFLASKNRLIELLHSKVEDKSVQMQQLYAKFGRSVMSENSETDMKAANQCRILEGEQNALEECIDLLQTEL